MPSLESEAEHPTSDSGNDDSAKQPSPPEAEPPKPDESVEDKQDKIGIADPEPAHIPTITTSHYDGSAAPPSQIHSSASPSSTPQIPKDEPTTTPPSHESTQDNINTTPPPDPTLKKADADADATALTRTPSLPPHTILSERAKILTIVLASFTAFVSPVSGAIYFPAINTLSSDLHVSVSLINLTITTYMLLQGLAPSLIGSFSDERGRRPALLICLALYAAACLGLALQDAYPALAALRCVQSAGSSGTVVLALGVVADLTTRAERGRYVGWASLGVTLGPALGPLIGGLLSHFLGWRAIFWFLAVYGGCALGAVALGMPETSRNVVGNGSVPPQWWNRSLLQWWGERRKRRSGVGGQTGTLERKRKRVNPVASLLVVCNKEEGTILLMGSLIFAGFYAVLSSLSPTLRNAYGLNDLQIGAAYVPYGVGSLSCRWVLMKLVDWNFRRHAKKVGMEIRRNRQQDIDNFPIERVRLEVCLPLLYLASTVVIIYSWMLHITAPLPAPLVCLYFVGFFSTGSFSMMNTLVVDINHTSPATAMAGNNLVRCLAGAGAVAVVQPLIERIGIGWTGTFVAGLWVAFSPSLWLVMKYGMQWRAEKRAKEEAKEKKLEERAKKRDPEKQEKQ